MTQRLFHLVDPAVWAAAERAGTYHPASLAAEGFIHLSFLDQVAGSANRHYRDAEELVVVEVDAAMIGEQVRIEDSYGSGTSFPHLYGPLPASAVIEVHLIERAGDGEWDFRPGR